MTIKKRVSYVEEETGFVFTHKPIDGTIRAVPTAIGFEVYYLVQDECPINPFDDCEGNGRFVHWKDHRGEEYREYCLALAVDPDTREAAEGQEADPTAVLIDKFEHSGEAYYLSGEYAGPDARWDLSRGWAVWLPDKCLLDELAGIKDKAKRRAKCILWARQACELYNQLASGDVYGIVNEAYDKDKKPLPDQYDSCWGYFGYEDTLKELESQAGIKPARLSILGKENGVLIKDVNPF